MTPQDHSPDIPERPPIRISVVIVSFNRIDQLRENLKALGTAHQIVVVDNGSPGISGIEPEFPNVRWSRLPKNFGLTKALNIGIRASEGEYILLLHDDVSITGDAVSQLADYLESHEDTAAVCPLLVDASGAPVPQIQDLPTPSNASPAIQTPPAGDFVVGGVTGAAMMFRAFYLRALRHIDERYGNYGSHLELCQQVRKSSKKVRILHSVTAIHEISQSPMPQSALAGDRAAGLAAFLGKHHGMVSGLLYRIKTALVALFTLRFSVLMGVLSGQKIDGTAN